MATATPSFGPCSSARELSAMLREKILVGDYEPGSKLPTVRELVSHTRLSYNTVAKAMGMLANEGLVQAQRGSGSFVAEQHPRASGEPSSLNIFALVVPMVQGGFCSSLQAGFDAAANELERQVLVCNTENDVKNQADVLFQLIDKQVGGAAIMTVGSQATPSHQVRVLQKCGIPVVLLREVEGVKAPILAVPHEQIGFQAAKELTKRGHRRIALLFPGRQLGAERYLAGFQRGLARADIDADDIQVLYGSHTPWSIDDLRVIEKQVEDVLTQDKERRPTAMFISSEELAEVAYLVVNRMGLDLGRDISLLTFGDAWRNGAVSMQLSALTVDEASVGRKAAQTLQEIIAGTRSLLDDSRVAIDVTLYGGHTLGQASIEQQ